MAIRILSSENVTGKLTLTGQQELLELTRGGASDSKWFFSADSSKLYIAENTSATQNIKVTLKDDGNVGIGTISPDAKLEVFAGASTTQDDILWGGIIRNNANSAVNTGYGAGLKLKVSSDTTGEVNKWAGIAGIAGSTFSNVTDLAFYANPTASNVPIELMRLTGEGNVGIGTASTEGKLTISYTAAELPTSGTASNSAIQVISSLNNQLNLGLNTVNGDYGAYIQASDNNLAVPYPLNLQPNGGNVGIGTILPAEKLTVNGNIITQGGSTNTGYDRYLKLYGNTAPATNTHRWAGLAVYNNGGNNVNELAFFTGSGDTARTEKMRLDAGGFLGIGTTDPLDQLHINNDTSNSYATLRLEGANRGGIINFYNAGYPVFQMLGEQSGNMYFATSGAFGSTTMTTRFTFSTTGAFGVGTTSFAPTVLKQLKIGDMGSGVVGEIHDAALVAGASQLILSTASGAGVVPAISLRHYSAAYGIDIWMKDTTPWNTYIDNRHPSSGFQFRNNTNNDGSEVPLMIIKGDGVVEVAGDLSVGGANKARFKSDGTNTYVDAIPANSEIRFRVAGAVEKFRIAASGATTQTMDSTTSLSHLWSQGVPLQNTWYTVYTYSQYDSVCFFAMVSFENDAGDGANQSAMFATSAGAAYGAAFGVQQISGGTGIEARRSSTSFQVRQTIGGYTASTRLNVRFVSIN